MRVVFCPFFNLKKYLIWKLLLCLVKCFDKNGLLGNCLMPVAAAVAIGAHYDAEVDRVGRRKMKRFRRWGFVDDSFSQTFEEG